MHNEAFQWVARFATTDQVDVLEIGSKNINGSPRSLFPNAVWHGIDTTPGRDVDEVCSAEEYNPGEKRFDFVICCEVFEHTPNWRTILIRALGWLKPGGRLIITAASDNRKAHSGHDGGPLRAGEHYGNICPLELEQLVARRSVYAFRVQTGRSGQDVYGEFWYRDPISPRRGEAFDTKPWEGYWSRKPWEYAVTVAIPVLNASAAVSRIVELHRLQTVRPFIQLIDTGSDPEELARLQSLAAHDVEVHSLRLAGVRHPSDFPAIAMDLAFATARTDFVFATHADCFPRSRNLLFEFMSRCGESRTVKPPHEWTLQYGNQEFIVTRKGTRWTAVVAGVQREWRYLKGWFRELSGNREFDRQPDRGLWPVVGYELTERPHSDWPGMFGHTATLFHMPTMDKINAGWSLRRLINNYPHPDGVETQHSPQPATSPNFPDTEILTNYQVWNSGNCALIVGTEKNATRTVDERIDHCRSWASAALYRGNPEYLRKASEWVEDGIRKADERITQWRESQS